jgi:4-hydroxy-2-oxoheptanedioate aldolase
MDPVATSDLMTTTHDDVFKHHLASGQPQFGMWVASGNEVNAEICATAGFDWILVDTEHAPNDVRSVQRQLQAIQAYPVCTVVRPAIGDPVLLKQYMDIGAKGFLIPMVESATQAEQLVAAVRYPPRGVRGVGAGMARSARWGTNAGYLSTADEGITLLVQVESVTALANLTEITKVDGVDGVFIGPSDLAASMGLLGQPEHPDVVAAVDGALGTIVATGKPAGVNAFNENRARHYLGVGATFVAVGADVTLLARGAQALARAFKMES